MTTDMTVAKTILAQLGGGRFVAMTGARHMTGSANSLSFGLPRFPGVKVNKVKITLTPMDLYDVEFYRINVRAKDPCKLIERHEGVYDDMLQNVFTSATGLATRL